MRVVIADDEPLARERLRGLLAEQRGVEVVAEAADGQHALHACAEHRPDLVLLDIAMPGIDGLEAARHLAAFEPRPAVVSAESAGPFATTDQAAGAVSARRTRALRSGWSKQGKSWFASAGTSRV